MPLLFLGIPSLVSWIAGLGATTAVTTLTAVTVGQVAAEAAAVTGAGLVGRSLYDLGRKHGLAEGRATIDAEIQAQSARLDEI
jgi:hypothetical protein